MDSPESATPGEGGERRSPSLEDSLRQFGQAGRAGAASAMDAGRALRGLVAADLALARAALVRTLVWLAVAAIFGASSWLLLMATLIAALQRFGISWLASLGIAAGLSLAVTALGAWQTTRYFAHTRLDATRRQLAKLGIGGDDDGEDEE
ncbi:MAG: phage holin family protein [Pseudoxanthomonas sp.]